MRTIDSRCPIPALRRAMPVLALSAALAGALGPAGTVTAARAQSTVPPPDVIQPACPIVVDPVPSGVTDRPAAELGTWPDYNFVHSSTHLQGAPATEKFAPGLLWNPPAPLELSGFRSVIAIANPNPATGLTADVELYDEGGALLAVIPVNLPPEGSTTVTAAALAAGSPAGRGSARVVSTNGTAFVGETIHHTLSVNLEAFGGPVVTDPDPFNPGATSLQQLQVRQAGKTSLFLGPFPVSDQSSIDFLNGNAPFLWVMNPNPVPATVSVALLSRLGINLGTATVTLQPFATYLELRLWSLLWGQYLSGAINYDDDFLVAVFADQPVVGEAVMTDLFGNGSGPGDHLRLGDRFRMGSAMLANTPALRVWNPELTYQPASVGIQTLMGILNAGNGDAGPVRIQYVNRNGVSLGSDTLGSLPRGAMARIGPGLPASPNYPAGAVFDGWVRITGCKPGLVGWTMRTAGDEPLASQPTPFKKVWGEALAGANGAEPGNGVSVTVGGQSWVRKTASIVRVDPSFYWPGYTTFLNHAASNVGPYWYRFFTPAGANVTLAAGQPFAGLRFGNTSFSFEDPQVNPSLVFFATILSERVDHTNGSIQGIHVIGDPMVEWEIFSGND